VLVKSNEQSDAEAAALAVRRACATQDDSLSVLDSHLQQCELFPVGPVIAAQAGL